MFPEASYTYDLKRPIVPLMMQRDYKPDGGLGLIVATKLYIDFAKHEFDTAYSMLIEQLRPHLSDAPAAVDGTFMHVSLLTCRQ